MNVSLRSLTSLNDWQKSRLEDANLQSASDLLVASPDGVAKKTRLDVSEVNTMLDKVSREILMPPLPVAALQGSATETCFTTGDPELDSLLGGGIRTGNVWEITGEGATGKTQLAFQLALTVQLPIHLKGLHGSVCYITAGSILETRRLQQIMQEHPSLSQNVCSMDDIQSAVVSSTEMLASYLRGAVPLLARANPPSGKLLKLLVVDSLASLFPAVEKSDPTYLFERSKALVEISMLLHDLVAAYSLAVVVINDAKDVFEVEEGFMHAKNELLYDVQSRWFNRPDDTFRDEKKEASLGLVWANQINIRIFLSKTGRTTHYGPTSPPADDGRSSKRRKLEGPIASTTPPPDIRPTSSTILLRRLDVVFSPFSSPGSIDFVLTPSGLKSLSSGGFASAKQAFFGGPVDLASAVQANALIDDQIPKPVPSSPVLDEYDLLLEQEVDDFTDGPLEQDTQEDPTTDVPDDN